MKTKIFFAATFVVSSIYAQQSNPCYFDHVNNQNSKVIQDTEEKISRFLNRPKKNLKINSHSTKRIPVVVHIVHNGGSENISDAQVQSQITVLNEDFRKKAGTNGDGNGTDTKIEFVLAQKNPSGKCTNGIVRIKSALTNHQTYQRGKLKELSFWDNTRYLNIYIVKSINTGSGTLGYASFPGGPNDEDGIVILHNAFGTIGTVSSGSTYNKGRTATHEIGHWLGLYHTFNNGCGTDSCSSGDLVCDTPPAANPNYGCPSVNSCNNDVPNLPDQISNYMDYSNDACKSMFSNGQKLRMEASLSSIRSQIYSDANLVFTGCDTDYVSPPCNVIADFAASGTNVCVGNTINFISRAQNNPLTWRWYFPGGTPSSSTIETPAVKYNSTGSYNVKLVVTNSLGTDSIEIPNYISITDPPIGQALPFIENFEASTFPANGIVINNPDGGITWNPTDTAAYSGTWSVKINNLINTNYGQSDEIILPAFDLSTYLEIPYLKFNWAYARSDVNYSDELIVLVSTDCGLNFTQVLYKTGSSLATGPTQTTPFIPTSSQWKEAKIDLSAYKTFQNVIVKFVNVTDGGNNLYIDNLSLGEVATGINTLSPIDISISPNPANRNVTVEYTMPFAGDVNICLLDLLGRKIRDVENHVKQEGKNKTVINADFLHNGLYFLDFKIGNQRMIKKVVINK